MTLVSVSGHIGDIIANGTLLNTRALSQFSLKVHSVGQNVFSDSEKEFFLLITLEQRLRPRRILGHSIRRDPSTPAKWVLFLWLR